MDCTPQALMDAAKCFRCIPRGMTGDVMVYLTCEWISGAPNPPYCGVPSDVIELTGAGLAGANQQYEHVLPTQWQGVTDPTWVIELFGGIWTVVNPFEPDQYFTTEANFPCLWELLPTGTGPPPTGVYVNVEEVILSDGSGGFWLIVVDTSGNIGTVSSAGPATGDVILDDGSGGFWKVIVDAGGNRGTTSDAGPATMPTAIDDGTGTEWTLVVDPAGNLGAMS